MPHPNTAHVRAHRQRNLVQGLCTNCSKPIDFTRSKRRCAPCLDKARTLPSRERRSKRKQVKQDGCKVCGAALSVKQYSYCTAHDSEHPKAKAMNYYKITSAQYEALGWICRLCGKTNDLQIDHDHATGIVRGRLCGPCNRQLARLETDGLFQRIVTYLK